MLKLALSRFRQPCLPRKRRPLCHGHSAAPPESAGPNRIFGDEPDVVEVSTAPPTPPPAFKPHPRYFYEDGNVFVKAGEYMFRVHAYHFSSEENSLSSQLKVGPSSVRRPICLPEDVKISSFENVLYVLYRHPLDSTPIHIRTLKDACLTSHMLGMMALCNLIAKHILLNDCPDESLDDAVPKYTLAIKLPYFFPKSFKDVQVDKLCRAVAYMSHSHFFELGFVELGKVWKAALVAREGYDGQRMETYDPPADPPRQSYLIKVKNGNGYRAIKRELFG